MAKKINRREHSKTILYAGVLKVIIYKATWQWATAVTVALKGGLMLEIGQLLKEADDD